MLNCQLDVYPGFSMFSSGTVRLCIMRVYKSRDYDAARAHCSSIENGRLVIVDTPGKAQAIQSKITAGIYVGLTDENVEDSFVWSDGRAMTSQERGMFAAGEPNNAGASSTWEGEDCVVIGPDLKFYDVACYKEKHFICELNIFK